MPVPISIHDKSDDPEIQQLEVSKFPLSEERGVLSDSSSKKTDEWVPAKTRYGRTVGRKDGAYDPSSGATIKWDDLIATEVEEDDIMVTSSNYYEVLEIDENEVKVLQEFNDSLSEYLNVQARIGGGFVNTNELRVMGYYYEAINGPDGELWREEVQTEHGRIVQSGVFEAVKRNELPNGVIVIDKV